MLQGDAVPAPCVYLVSRSIGEQCVAVCFSALQWVAVGCSDVALCCSDVAVMSQ